MPDRLLTQVQVLYQDQHILAINKPSGLVVHPDGRTQELSLVDWLSVYVGPNRDAQENIGNPHTLDSGRYEKRWGILNRLDRETSGVVLVAKDPDTFFDLQQQFLSHVVKKEYLALVWGQVEIKPEVNSPVPGTFKISEPISRHKKDPRIWVCGTGVGERQTKRNAETIVEVDSKQKNTTVVKLFPITGRTHQLRLHTRFIGHPIVGDKKYGINGIANEHGIEQILPVLDFLQKQKIDAVELDRKSRLMLHARSIVFVHPFTKEKVKIETPEEDFLQLMF